MPGVMPSLLCWYRRRGRPRCARPRDAHESASQPEKPQPSGKGQLNGSQPRPAQRPTVHRTRERSRRSLSRSWKPNHRRGCVIALIAEITGLGSSDDAAMWAHRASVKRTGWPQPTPGKSRKPSKRERQPSQAVSRTPSHQCWQTRSCRGHWPVPAQAIRTVGGKPRQSTRACWRCRRRVGFATATTSSLSLKIPV